MLSTGVNTVLFYIAPVSLECVPHIEVCVFGVLFPIRTDEIKNIFARAQQSKNKFRLRETTKSTLPQGERVWERGKYLLQRISPSLGATYTIEPIRKLWTQLGTGKKCKSTYQIWAVITKKRKDVSRKHTLICSTPPRYANGITDRYAPHTDQARPTGGRDTAKGDGKSP